MELKRLLAAGAQLVWNKPIPHEEEMVSMLRSGLASLQGEGSTSQGTSVTSPSAAGTSTPSGSNGGRGSTSDDSSTAQEARPQRPGAATSGSSSSTRSTTSTGGGESGDHSATVVDEDEIYEI